MGHLFCFDAAKGGVLWSKDLVARPSWSCFQGLEAPATYKIKMPTWGIAAAPLVEDGLVIVQIGGRENACFVAFDKITGKEKWRALNDPASYSAPIVIKQAGKRVLVCWTGERIVGLNPLTGKLYWQHPFRASRNIDYIATPVFQNNYLFVSSFFDGSLLLKVEPDSLAVEKVWRRKGPNERKTESLHCCISTPLLQGDYTYGVDSYGELRCLNLQTGERIWENLDAIGKARWAKLAFSV